MTKSILIGKLIAHYLKADDFIFEQLGNKIYPLIGNNKTTFPFVVYWKENVLPNYTKDWLTDDTVTFSILVTDTSYENCLDLAQAIRTVFERPKLKTDFMEVNEVHLTNLAEDFVENAYVQTLTFECNVQNN